MGASADYRRIEGAIEYLRRHRREAPSLEATAAAVGLSPFHFQRLFQRWAGTTPKRFLQYLTAEAARSYLREARSVLAATYDVGLSSPGRLHDLLVTVAAVTPGEVRQGGRGLTIHYGTHETYLGETHIAVTARGILRLTFGSQDDILGCLSSDWPNADLIQSADRTAPLIDRIFAPPTGRSAPFPVCLRGTNLQLRVWEALLCIPEGAVVSYGGLAAALDKPRAARAVASAVAANPIGYLIPCHRVLRATGEIGGYRWGTDRKRALLAREFSRQDASHLPNR